MLGQVFWNIKYIAIETILKLKIEEKKMIWHNAMGLKNKFILQVSLNVQKDLMHSKKDIYKVCNILGKYLKPMNITKNMYIKLGTLKNSNVYYLTTKW